MVVFLALRHVKSTLSDYLTPEGEGGGADFSKAGEIYGANNRQRRSYNPVREYDALYLGLVSISTHLSTYLPTYTARVGYR